MRLLSNVPFSLLIQDKFDTRILAFNFLYFQRIRFRTINRTDEHVTITHIQE